MSTLAILAAATSAALGEACVQDEPLVWMIGDISAALLTAARLLGPAPLVRFVEGTRLLPATAGRKQYVDLIVDGLCLLEDTAWQTTLSPQAQSQLQGVVDEKTEEAMRLFGEWLDPGNTFPRQDIFRLYPVLTGIIFMSTLETCRQLGRGDDSDARSTNSGRLDAGASQPLEKPPSIIGMLQASHLARPEKTHSQRIRVQGRQVPVLSGPPFQECLSDIIHSSLAGDAGASVQGNCGVAQLI
ncbi:hypothetical protein LZ32DRAFT_659450 [Colletotrichum eremochloae]|nr:hypothetical protein LZ32DRAFT_659450 [Colletotrichum eremochloae]